MLRAFTWHWGTKYGRHYVERLIAGLARNSTLESLTVLDIADEDKHLEGRGCLARLRMFDPKWQESKGLKAGDGIVCFDLDIVIIGQLDPLFDRDDDFTILQGVNTHNPNPYNGSVWMLKAGTHADVWRDFSIEAAAKIPHYLLSDDQDWMHHKIPNAAAWGPKDGVYAFQKVGWPKGDALPSNARIVAFPGKRDPSQFQHLDWVKRHWMC